MLCIQLITLATLLLSCSAVPIVAQPDDASNITITTDYTLGATVSASRDHAKRRDVFVRASTSGQNLQLAFVNHIASTNVHAYVTGIDPESGALIILQPNGKWFTPSATTSTTPVLITEDIAILLGGEGSTKEIELPGYIESGRVWIANGNLKFFTVNGASLVQPSAMNPHDPSADIRWGFVELSTVPGQGLWADVTYVDFVGLALGVTLSSDDGSLQTVQGLRGGSVNDVCRNLEAQTAKDGRPWDKLCFTDHNDDSLRVVSPTNYISLHPTAFKKYWTAYVDNVWTRYRANTLTMNTLAGPVACRVTGSQLTCAGDDLGYSKPSAADIFGCSSGPFAAGVGNAVHNAVRPILCAAFNRGTLLHADGNVQPSPMAGYYTSSPHNWYSSTVHKHEADGKGYAFPFDDVEPNYGTDLAGVVNSPNPRLLTVVVGGPAS